ncbi:MAG TPA: hypothetical protein ENN67_05020 [Firmicutes bacterium]|nr:hypothetical protein [Bacillota bacterium]
MKDKYKIGSVKYLNAEPLIWPLEHGEIGEPIKIKRSFPGELPNMLISGELDCAIAPVAVLLEHPDLVPLPDVAIASRGAVASVLVFHNVPFDGIETLWLDPASRTSNLLARILRSMSKKLSCNYVIPTEDEAPGINDLPSGHGRLIIGDAALAYSVDSEIKVQFTDLGLLWKEKTNHPFVYARWIAQNGDIAAELAGTVRESRDWSVLNLHKLIEPLAEKYNFPVSLVDRYLRTNITYMFGPREQSGENEFFRLAKKLENI